MSNLTSDPTGAGQPLYTSSAQPFHGLGERMVTPDGRVFRYARAGALDLVPGSLCQMAAQIAGHQGLVVAAASVGATSISVTLGGTAATLNQYAGGLAIVTVGAGLGQALAISGHEAQANGAGVLVLTLSDAVRVALTGTTRIDLVPNAYNGLIISPTTLTAIPVGVPPAAIVANEYGWVQRSGPAAVLTAGANAVGGVVGAPGSVAGAVVVGTAALISIGSMMETGAAGETNAVMLAME